MNWLEIKTSRSKCAHIKKNILFYGVSSMSVLLLLFCVMYDIGIRKYPNLPYIHVSNDYIGMIFGGLCSVATLGSALQSIIIGAHSNKILGFPVREVINFSAEKFNVRHTVCFSLLAVIIAIPALALNFCSTVTIITVIVLVHMTYSGVHIWKLLSDSNYENTVVNIEIETRGTKNPDFFFNTWFSELQDAIQKNDAPRQDTYIELIKVVVDKCDEAGVDTSNLLSKYLTTTFSTACYNLGFVPAYQKVLCLNAPRVQIKADLDTIVSKHIETIRYCPESSIQNYRIANTVDHILDSLEVENFTKKRYVLNFYDAVIENSIISEKTRYQIIDSILQKLCYLRDQNSGDMRGKILLYIAKYSIFENENDEERKKVLILVLNNLFNENRYSRENCYFSVVAQLFRGIYFYCVYETETLSPVYRENLAKLYNYGENGKNNFKVTLSTLVNQNTSVIIEWLTNDAVNHNGQLNIFEYFPANFYCKNAIWEQGTLLRFAFLVYSIFGYRFYLFPAAKIVQDEKADISLKRGICTQLVAMSNSEFKLNDDSQAALRQMQTFLGCKKIIPNQYFVENFKFFNAKLSELTTKQNEAVLEETSDNIQRLSSELETMLSSLKSFKFNSQIPLEKSQHFKIQPSLRTIKANDIKYAAREKLDELKFILNEIINDTLRPEEVDFNLSGIKKLLVLLGQDTYHFKNYVYIDDLAITKEIRNTNEYRELEEVLSAIPYNESCELNNYIFLKQKSIEFNFSIIDYHLDPPTEEQCQDYINGFKVAEGKYRIDGIIQDFAEAMKYVQKNYRSESSEICIATNITRDSGFVVTFR